MVEYIGIDIGGTNIRVGAMDENENMIYIHKEKTHKKETETAEELFKRIKTMIENVPDYQQAKAIGIGFPGAIDYNTNKILTARNIETLKDFPLVERIEKEFNKPTYIENDAKVATLAEAIKGNGKDKNIVCYITISTGFGGGLTIDKKLYKGSNGLGAYFSRLILDGEHTSDYLISGTGLIRQARERINPNISNTKEILEFERKGNKEAIEIISELKKYLTSALLNISATFNPDIIILGGGVTNEHESFLLEVVEKFKEKAHPLAKNTIIQVTEMQEPGVVGACLLAKNK